jgi:hypothetical protein
MDTKFNGIVNPGDTREIQEWMERQIGSLSDRKTELANIRIEIGLLRQTIDIMHKKIDHIERILEKVDV